MKKFLMLLTFVVTACAQNDVPVDATDDVQMGVFEQLICGATACGGLEGQSYDDCMDFHCDGSSGGGGAGGGGGTGGGGGGGGEQYGSTQCGAWEPVDGLGCAYPNGGREIRRCCDYSTLGTPMGCYNQYRCMTPPP